jgi:plastocyanin
MTSPQRKVWMFSLALAMAANLVQVDQAMSKPTDSYAAPKKSPSSKTETVAKPAMVTIEGFQFQPDNVTIKKGGKVTFTNKDSTPHTVSPDEGIKFAGTGRLEQNTPKTLVFDTVGTQSYHCEIHPSMQGKITVVP